MAHDFLHLGCQSQISEIKQNNSIPRAKLLARDNFSSRHFKKIDFFLFCSFNNLANFPSPEPGWIR
jgi:hypothetical protein